MPELSKLATTNIRLLKVLQRDGPSTAAGIAVELARDPDNTRKTLKALVDDGTLARGDSGAYDLGPGTLEAMAALGVAAPVGGPAAPATTETAPDAALALGVQEMAIGLIEPDRELNPRTEFAEEPLAELAQSIREQGVLQPILVRPVADHAARPRHVRVVAGERRFLAARRAGLTAMPVILRELTDDQALIIALTENIQREQLNYIEEARTFDRIIQAKVRQGAEPIRAKEDVAQVASKTVRLVEQRLDLLKLAPAEQARLTLPRDDPKHLSIRDARWAIQRHDQAQARIDNLKAQLEGGVDLILAEVFDKLETDAAPGGYYGKRCEVAADAEIPQALIAENVLTFTGADRTDGRAYVSLGWQCNKELLGRVIPDLTGRKRPELLHAMRTRIFGAGIADQVRDEKRYATVWLNGPFEPDPEVLAANQVDLGHRAAQERAQQVQQQAHEALHLDVTAFEAAAATMEPAARSQALTDLLVRAGGPAPWAYPQDGWAIAAAANGAQITIHSAVARRLLILAVNIAAGVPADAWPSTTELPDASDAAAASDDDNAPLDRPAFEAAMAAAFIGTQPSITAEAAAALAAQSLERLLVEEGIEYGHPDWGWSAEDAKAAAKQSLEHSEPAA